MDGQDEQDEQDEYQKARQRHEKTNIRNYETREKYVAEVSCHKRPACSAGHCAGRRKTTMLHVSLTPQHDAGQLDFGRIKVLVIFSTHVIENQPIIRNIHRFSRIVPVKEALRRICTQYVKM